jgi:DNA-binding MarR family transcriptional regulator
MCNCQLCNYQRNIVIKSQILNPSIDLILSEFLPYRLYNAAEKVSLSFAHVYKDKYGLNRPEWRVLAVLAQHPKMTATEIGHQSKMHKTKVSRAVFELERRKWLARDLDNQDRRVEWLYLTKFGKLRFAGLSDLARAFEAGLIEALGAKAAAQLALALDKIEDMTLPIKRVTKSQADQRAPR